MSFLYNFFSQFFYKQPEISHSSEEFEEDDDIFIVKHLVTIQDIKSIRLNKVKESSDASQKEYDDLKKLILNVKLNHVTIDNKQNKEYKHRHPVLNELREKFKK